MTAATILATFGFVLSAPAAVGAASAGPAEGSITVTPVTGNDLVAFTLTTSGECPAGSTNAFATVFGPGLPSSGVNVVPNSALSVFPRTVGGGVAMSSSNTLRTLVSQLPDPQVLEGTYRLRVQCRKGPLVADLGDFSGTLVFDGHHGYKATNPDIPAASLVTIAAPVGPPLPTAVGSQPPVTSPTPAAAESKTVTTGSRGAGSGGALWLIVAGVLVALGGLVSLFRSRRSPAAKVSAP